MKAIFFLLFIHFVFGKQLALNNPICDAVQKVLPPFCHLGFCNPSITMNVNCDVDLLGKLKFNTDIYINLCAEPVNINATFTPPNWHTKVESTVAIPVPGLSVDTPIGSAGVFFDVTLGTKVNNVDISLGIDACASVFDLKECFPKVLFDH